MQIRRNTKFYTISTIDGVSKDITVNSEVCEELDAAGPGHVKEYVEIVEDAGLRCRLSKRDKEIYKGIKSGRGPMAVVIEVSN